MSLVEFKKMEKARKIGKVDLSVFMKFWESF